jgi:predicted metalloprotease
VLPQETNRQYPRATLVVFRGEIESACGYAESASGPFYCPGDNKVYIDLGFYDDLQSRFGAAGDFAQAYVIAHEIGHHVQHVLGIDNQMRRAQQQRPDLANPLSVRLELQADCLAGVWGHSTAQRALREPGDIEEGLNAAAAIGDDRLQRMSGRGVRPEKFTHGSSAQRVEWFRRGLESGRMAACDTFGQ